MEPAHSAASRKRSRVFREAPSRTSLARAPPGAIKVFLVKDNREAALIRRNEVAPPERIYAPRSKISRFPVGLL
jgi:hypothetical protein